MKQQFEHLIFTSQQHVNEGVFIIDRDGTIIDVNDFVCHYLGYAYHEITGMKVWELDPFLNTPDSFKNIQSEKRRYFETLHRHKNGHDIPVEVCTAMQDIDGEWFAVAYVRDITKRKEQEERLTLFHEMLDESHDMIYIIRINDGWVEYINQTVTTMTGYTLEEIQTIGIEGFRRPLKEGEAFHEHLQELKKKKQLTDYAVLIRKDGSEFPVEANVRNVKRGNVDYNIAIVRDISERVKAEEQLEMINRRLEEAVEEKTAELQKSIAFLEGHKKAMDAGNIVSKSDLKGNITYVNDRFCQVTGYTKEEVMGKPHSIVRHPDTEEAVFADLWATIKSKKMWQGTLKNRKKDGSHYWVDINILPILDDRGEIFEYIAVRHDITELVEQRRLLEKIATTDALTGFGNRYKLLGDITRAPNPSLALINLDNFREINDFYGHAFGDLLIKKVARTISDLIRDKEAKKLYRLHADEFAILNCSMENNHFTERIREIIDSVAMTNYVINNEEISMQLTASLSFDANKAGLFTGADMMMKRAKKTQQSLVIYDETLSLDEEYQNNILWAKKLRSAIHEDRLVPFYQPIVNNATGEWEKYECLVRLIDEEGTVISPYFFLDIAKRTKHYLSLTKAVIDHAFETFKSHEAEFSINLTIKDIMDEEVRHYIFSKLEQYGIGNRLVFEIVESEGITNYSAVIRFIEQIKAYGCRIAIDDFGSGYSNFQYLMKLQADYIKIDGSLIRELDTDTHARIIVSNIVRFAKDLGIPTIAEFVKDETISRAVADLGIEYSQGYHFGEPAARPER